MRVCLFFIYIIFNILYLGQNSAEAQELSLAVRDVGAFHVGLQLVNPIGSAAPLPGIPEWTSDLRLQLGLTPLRLSDYRARYDFFVSQGSFGIMSGTRRLESTAVQVHLARGMRADFIRLERNRDRGVAFGGQVIHFRLPFRITRDGRVFVQPSFDAGFRSYENNQESVYAAAQADFQAVTTLFRHYMMFGIQARVRFDLDSYAPMTGFEEALVGFISVRIPPRASVGQPLYVRFYGGFDHNPQRTELGLPAAAIYTGVQLHGTIERMMR